MDVKEMHSVVVFTPKSDQSRRGGKWIHLGRLKLADELASLRVGRESHCETDIRRVFRQVDTLAGEYTLDRQR